MVLRGDGKGSILVRHYNFKYMEKKNELLDIKEVIYSDIFNPDELVNKEVNLPDEEKQSKRNTKKENKWKDS